MTIAFGAEAAASIDHVTTTRLEGTGGGSFASSVERLSDTSNAWSVIVKHIDEAPRRPDWDREAFAYADRAWLDRMLPDGLEAPRLLATHRFNGRVTLVLDDLGVDHGAAHTASTTAARLLAQFNGRASPPRPWWSRGFLSQEFTTLANHPERLESTSADARIEMLQSHLRRLLEKAPALLAELSALPHGPAHLDAYSRNLVGDGTNGPIGLVDWASAGTAPIGTDPATLFTLGLAYLDVDATGIEPLEAAIVDQMLAGLADVDAASNPDQTVRAFTGVSRLRFLAMMMNALPMVERRDPLVARIVGHPLDEVIDQWLAIGDHLLST